MASPPHFASLVLADCFGFRALDFKFRAPLALRAFKGGKDTDFNDYAFGALRHVVGSVAQRAGEAGRGLTR